MGRSVAVVRRAVLVGAVLGAAAAAPASAQTNLIQPFAGTGVAGSAGDGGQATAAQVNNPFGLAVLPDGSVLIADIATNRVRRVGTDGVILPFAGSGAVGDAGDGALAVVAMMRNPSGVAVAPDGSVLIADNNNSKVRRVGTDGVITTFAGTGVAGLSGDGGQAVDAQLSFPSDVAVAPDGSVLIVDTGNSRIRRVSTTGVITTFAGTVTGWAGDGGQATEARLNFPADAAVAADGSVLIADDANHRIRRVAPDGVITTFAGTGVAGFSGDGGPAAAAQLRFPSGVAVAPDGSVLIADGSNHRIRRVAPDGTITTLAGTGVAGFSGDGALATAAQLNSPFRVEAMPDGRVLISDSLNRRVRIVDAGLVPPAPQSGCAPAVAALDPVACWRFDEPSGTDLTDGTGNGHDGVYQGGPSFGQLGVLGDTTAALFDGVDDLGRIPDADGLDLGDSFTLEAWVKRSSTAKTHQLMLRGGNSFQLTVMPASSGSQVFLRKANVSTVVRSSGGVPADGAFHHVVATKNGPHTARIYIDGVDQTVGVSPAQVLQNTATPMYFGSAGSNAATFDEFAIYDRALTPAEVAGLHAAGAPPSV